MIIHTRRRTYHVMVTDRNGEQTVLQPRSNPEDAHAELVRINESLGRMEPLELPDGTILPVTDIERLDILTATYES